MTEQMSLAQALDELRIPSEQAETMLAEVVAAMNNPALSERLRDRGFHTQALVLTQDLVAAITLAEATAVDGGFDAMFVGAQFAHGDADLAALAKTMLDWMVASPRSIPVDTALFAGRVGLIRRSI